MAYAKKASRRYRRSRRSRRYTRRRRYRRYYPRRSGKRFPKGTEVKSVSKSFTRAFVYSQYGETQNTTFNPGFVTMIGLKDEQVYGLHIPQGTAQGERVGAKIEPIKLRISGAISLATRGSDQVRNAPNFWQVRCVVYQVKGGNTNYSPNSSNYHPLAMATSDGTLGGSSLVRLLMTYHYTSNNDLVFAQTDWQKNNFLAKIPLRRGIGSMMRVLYKKSFWINTQKNPIKQFRFVTKPPKRLIYPEMPTQGDDDNSANYPNSAIYILWMFQPGTFDPNDVPYLNLDYNVDLFYTDK